MDGVDNSEIPTREDLNRVPKFQRELELWRNSAARVITHDRHAKSEHAGNIVKNNAL